MVLGRKRINFEGNNFIDFEISVELKKSNNLRNSSLKSKFGKLSLNSNYSYKNYNPNNFFLFEVSYFDDLTQFKSKLDLLPDDISLIYIYVNVIQNKIKEYCNLHQYIFIESVSSTPIYQAILAQK